MKRRILSALLIATLLAGTALAQSLPSYYPEDGFQRTGHVDALNIEEGFVVIDDVPYRLSESVVVHSLSAYSVTISRVRAGQTIGYKLNGRQIVEIWLLPSTYDDSRSRR